MNRKPQIVNGELRAQGVYYFATGIWPLLHMRSFVAITGPKTDLWLVRTVGVLVMAIGASLAVASFRRPPTIEARFLASASALGLAAIDIYYAGKGRISRIYLLDAAAEAAGVIVLVAARR